MKVVKAPIPVAKPKRLRGAVILDRGVAYIEVGNGPVADSVVNLETGELLIQDCPFRDETDVVCPNAVLLLDGVQPVPVPPVKSGLQQAQEFVTWYYNNPGVSGASSLTTYTPQDVLNLATNANVRRQWATWLAARGV